jgi:hypothetical protein
MAKSKRKGQAPLAAIAANALRRQQKLAAQANASSSSDDSDNIPPSSTHSPTVFQKVITTRQTVHGFTHTRQVRTSDMRMRSPDQEDDVVVQSATPYKSQRYDPHKRSSSGLSLSKRRKASLGSISSTSSGGGASRAVLPRDRDYVIRVGWTFQGQQEYQEPRRSNGWRMTMQLHWWQSTNSLTNVAA